MNGNVSSAVRFTDARVYNSIHLTGGGGGEEGGEEGDGGNIMRNYFYN